MNRAAIWTDDDPMRANGVKIDDRPRAFSLIELVVVLVIIAILMPSPFPE